MAEQGGGHRKRLAALLRDTDPPGPTGTGAKPNIEPVRTGHGCLHMDSEVAHTGDRRRALRNLYRTPLALCAFFSPDRGMGSRFKPHQAIFSPASYIRTLI